VSHAVLCEDGTKGGLNWLAGFDQCCWCFLFLSFVLLLDTLKIDRRDRLLCLRIAEQLDNMFASGSSVATITTSESYQRKICYNGANVCVCVCVCVCV
jgi:hypothetical protein